MSEASQVITTTTDRESNPKAVFYGTNTGIVTPLAFYLSERSVELYTANVLSDAFFGNYFLYIGDGQFVEEFVAEYGPKLPRSLLLINPDSDLDTLKKHIFLNQLIKIVIVDQKKTLTEKEVQAIFEFFFGSKEQILELGTPIMAVSEKPPKEPHEELLKREKTSFLADLTTDKNHPSPKNLISVEPLAETIPELGVEADSRDRELPKRVAAFFTDNSQKTGKAASRIGKIRLPLIIASIVTLCLVIIFPLTIVCGSVILGSWSVWEGQQNLEKGQLSEAGKKFKLANLFLTLSSKNINGLISFLDLIKQRELARALLQGNQIVYRLGKSGTYIVSASQDAQLLVNGVFRDDKSVAFGQLISSIKGNLTLSDTELALVEAELKTASFQQLFTYPGFDLAKGTLSTLTTRLREAREGVRNARNALSILPEVIGVFGKRTYLLVFQNNMELRPTGGFIGSFGLLTFENGKLTDIKIEDVYTADGALKGHVDPPAAIKTHLGQEHWYMRDSNWNPDFRLSGRQIAWFLDKEIDTSVDGVMAVDVTFVKYLLDTVGSVQLPDYKKTINSENLYTESQNEAETDFFPGSTQKRDFLGSLGRALLTKLVTQKTYPNAHLAENLFKSLKERHLIIYFEDQTLEDEVNMFGWGGQLALPANCDRECIADFMLVVDANLGVNKANYYVTRKINDEVKFDIATLEHTTKITYKNSSPNSGGGGKWGGDYKNYARVYVPQDAELVSAQVGDTRLTLTEDEVATSSTATSGYENGWRVFSAWLTIPPQEEKTLTVSYTRPFPETTDSLRYVYKIQKQPGTEKEEFDLSLTFPNDWQITKVAGEGEVAGATTLVRDDKITYNSTLSEDQVYKFGISK